MQTRRHKNTLFKQSMRLLFIVPLLLLYAYVPSIFAQEVCSVTSNNANNEYRQKNVTLSLQEYGLIGEKIILHVDILQDAMPVNAWGRISVKSNVTFEDGIIQKGHITVLEGVPETTMHFTKKGFYELTISVGYLVKST